MEYLHYLIYPIAGILALLALGGLNRGSQKGPQVPDQARILDIYLLNAVALIAGKVEVPAARAGAQVFILGMADMLRQAENLSWEKFVAIYHSALELHDLLPNTSVDELIGTIGKAASTNSEVEQLMKDGAQSIRMYVAERDADAPMDLSRAVLFAESNNEIFAAIHGAT